MEEVNLDHTIVGGVAVGQRAAITHIYIYICENLDYVVTVDLVVGEPRLTDSNRS